VTSISLRNVVKRFGDAEVVRGLDLEFKDGEITVLVGPSGCGKTTTLRMIAGLETVTSGTIAIGDKDVTALEPKQRDVAMVFQNYALYPHLSVRDNIAFPLLARGGTRAEAARKADQIAGVLGITPLLNRKPRALSGGQQQRVAIGRAIVRSPQVFLFDEPLSNLDAKLRVEMRTEILRLQRQFGTTAVYVTHDQEEAMTLSDTMVVMRDGEIVQKGRPSDLYERPVDTFVATFIGSPTMNLVEGSSQAGVFTSPAGFTTRVAGALDGPLTVGIRPEDLLVGPRAEDEQRATVEIVELLGPRAIVSLQLGATPLTAVVEAADLATLREGELVPMSARPGAVHVFGTDGRRLTVP
jgi:multiple sugar transport system ATP-binding protein